MRKSILFLVFALAIVSCREQQQPPITYSGSQKQAIIDNILSRRAIRKYTQQQVSTEQIDTIMRSAIYAPSAWNKQPWEIRVIQNPDVLKEIDKRFVSYAEKNEPSGRAAKYREPGFSIYHNSPTLIVIASDKENPNAKLDAGIALQNILLGAHALGLGTCPLALIVPTFNAPENKDLMKTLNIPEGYEVAVGIALGYPAESPVAPIRYAEKAKIIK